MFETVPAVLQCWLDMPWADLASCTAKLLRMYSKIRGKLRACVGNIMIFWPGPTQLHDTSHLWEHVTTFHKYYQTIRTVQGQEFQKNFRHAPVAGIQEAVLLLAAVHCRSGCTRLIRRVFAAANTLINSNRVLRNSHNATIRLDGTAAFAEIQAIFGGIWAQTQDLARISWQCSC